MDYQKESFLKHTGNDVQLFVYLAGGKQQSCNLYPSFLSLFEHLKTFYHCLFLLTECEWLAIAEYLSQYHHFSKQYDIFLKSTGEKIFLDFCGPQEVSHGFLEGG